MLYSTSLELYTGFYALLCFVVAACLFYLYPSGLLNSQSGKMCYCKISWSLKAARLDDIMILLLWNLTGISAAEVPVEFQSDWKSLKPNQGFTRSCSKVSVCLVNRSIGLIYWYLIAPVAVKQPWRIWLNWSHTSTANWWHNHNKTKHKITVCVFDGTYCMWRGLLISWVPIWHMCNGIGQHWFNSLAPVRLSRN